MKLPKNLKDELDNFCYLIAAVVILAVTGYFSTNDVVVRGGFMLLGACLIKIKGGINNVSSKQD